MIVCVTGPMAAGKNLASEILCERGFACVDADLLVHEAVENAKEEILKTFSSPAKEKNISLLNEDGKINRRALGSLIFSDPALVQKQESIVYPHVNALFEKFICDNNGRNLAINATVLYKVPLMKKTDCVLFVDAPFLQRLLRARKRDKMPFKDILKRFLRQKNLFAKYKKSNADTVRVWNVGSRASLERKIDSFLRNHMPSDRG